MDLATMMLINQGVAEALRLALRGLELSKQHADGGISSDEARAAWQRMQGESYGPGRDAWDAAAAGEPVKLGPA